LAEINIHDEGSTDVGSVHKSGKQSTCQTLHHKRKCTYPCCCSYVLLLSFPYLVMFKTSLPFQGKVTPLHTMKAYRGNEGLTPLILNLSSTS